jgi:hypothetical protein
MSTTARPFPTAGFRAFLGALALASTTLSAMPSLPGIFSGPECAIALTRIEQDRADRFRARAERRRLGPRDVDEYVARSVRRRYLLERLRVLLRDEAIGRKFFERLELAGVWTRLQETLRSGAVAASIEDFRPWFWQRAPLLGALLTTRPPRTATEAVLASRLLGLGAAAAFYHWRLSTRFLDELPRDRPVGRHSRARLRALAAATEAEPQVVVAGLPFADGLGEPFDAVDREALLGEGRIPRVFRAVLAVHLDVERRYGIEPPAFHSAFARETAAYFRAP